MHELNPKSKAPLSIESQIINKKYKENVWYQCKTDLIDLTCSQTFIGKRARELFEALDEDGNGSLTEDEFVEGCMTDEAFVQLLRDFNGDFIWNWKFIV